MNYLSKIITMAALTLSLGTSMVSAATITSSIETDGTAGSYQLDLTNWIFDLTSSGLEATNVSGTLSFDGYSPEFDLGTVYKGVYFNYYSAAGFLFETHTFHIGDTTSDVATVTTSSSTRLYDNTYDYVSGTNQILTETDRYLEREIRHTFANYGELSASSTLSEADVSDLLDDGLLDVTFTNSGNPITVLDVTLSLEYDTVPLAAVPLPASGYLLIGGLFGLRALGRHTRRSTSTRKHRI